MAKVSDPVEKERLKLYEEMFEEYAVNPTSLEKLKEFNRQGLERVLKQATPEELRKVFPTEERLKGVSMDELINALSPEQLEALKQRLLDKGSPSKPD